MIQNSCNPLEMTDTLLKRVKESYGEEILYKCERKYLNPHSPVKPFSNPNGLVRGSSRYGSSYESRSRPSTSSTHENPFDILS